MFFGFDLIWEKRFKVIGLFLGWGAGIENRNLEVFYIRFG